jgi:hypothetical protein
MDACVATVAMAKVVLVVVISTLVFLVRDIVWLSKPGGAAGEGRQEWEQQGYRDCGGVRGVSFVCRYTYIFCSCKWKVLARLDDRSVMGRVQGWLFV